MNIAEYVLFLNTVKIWEGEEIKIRMICIFFFVVLFSVHTYCKTDDVPNSNHCRKNLDTNLHIYPAVQL